MFLRMILRRNSSLVNLERKCLGLRSAGVLHSSYKACFQTHWGLKVQGPSPLSTSLRALSTESDSYGLDNEALATEGEDTIASIVTGPSVGAVAIVRISGSDAVNIARRIFRSGHVGRDGAPPKALKDSWRPKSHQVYYGHIVDPTTEKLVDEVLLIPMLTPRSYTREDLIELHTHGGGICAQRVLQLCLESGARRARPGEFTLRAFLNGRLDLSQAEAVQQLVSARTVAAADSALAGLEGGLGATVRRLRLTALDLVAEVEARLDFDEDLGELDRGAFLSGLDELYKGVQEALNTARVGKLLRSGIQVALVGRPNVGKSSLLNRWSATERAIVTDIAGTTRDIVSIDVVAGGGVPLTLLDTAGLRESADVVERVGVERSRKAACQSDLVVFVADAGEGWTEGDATVFGELVEAWEAGGRRPPCVLCVNKTDRVGSGNGASPSSSSPSSSAPTLEGFGVPEKLRPYFAGAVGTSASRGTGVPELERTVLEVCTGSAAFGQGEGPASWAVNERQAEALVRAGEALDRTRGSVAQELPIDFWTIDLREVVVCLGEVTGDEVTEEVLDNIFSRFCIGK